MALISSRNSKLERAIRSRLHAIGFRYKLHVRGMAGTPDMVFPARGKVLFVHSCFWHGHKCNLGRMPKSNQSYWASKIATNQRRDARNAQLLRRQGWSVMSVWECKFRQNPDTIAYHRNGHRFNRLYIAERPALSKYQMKFKFKLNDCNGRRLCGNALIIRMP